MYKQLYRAAKAKLKLRIKATVVKPINTGPENIMDRPASPIEQPKPNAPEETRPSYLETVLAPSTYQSPANLDINGTSKSNTTVDLISGPKVQIATLPVSSAPPLTWRRQEDLRPEHSRLHVPPPGHFCIDCNHCGRGIENEHYHCSICDNGDYDLCLDCINSNVDCGEEGHWLIKRCFKDGKLINSTTETIAPKKTTGSQLLNDEPKSDAPVPESYDRVCNCCISGMSILQLTCT